MKFKNVRFILEERDYGNQFSLCASIEENNIPVLRNAYIMAAFEVLRPAEYGLPEKIYVATAKEVPRIEIVDPEDPDEYVLEPVSIHADNQGFYYMKEAPLIRPAITRRRTPEEVKYCLQLQLENWLEVVAKAGALLGPGTEE